MWKDIGKTCSGNLLNKRWQFLWIEELEENSTKDMEPKICHINWTASCENPLD